MAKKRTINLMISEEADTRLRALSAELKLPMGAIIEQAIMQWKPDTATEIEPASITDTIEARFNALESRLAALEAVGAVKVGAVGKVTVDAACELVGAEPGIEKVAVNQNDAAVESSPAVESDVVINQNKAAFDAAVIAAYKSGITKGADILRHVTEQGYRNSEGNPYYRSGVEHTLKRAGLKD